MTVSPRQIYRPEKNFTPHARYVELHESGFAAARAALAESAERAIPENLQETDDDD